MSRLHIRWKNLEEYLENVEWYYHRFLLLDHAFNPGSTLLSDEFPALSLANFIYDKGNRVLSPFRVWERCIETAQKVDSEVYPRLDGTHFDLSADQTRFPIFRKKDGCQGRTLLNQGGDRHNQDEQWASLARSIQWKSRPSALRSKRSGDRVDHVGIERDLQLSLKFMQRAREGTFPFDKDGNY